MIKKTKGYYQQRIHTLESRTEKENYRIIQKLKRQLNKST